MINVDKAWLHKYYHQKQLTQREIAKILGCTAPTISYWMRKFNIPVRNTKAYHILYDKKWLHEKYIVNELSLTDISMEVGCSVMNVLHWLRKHNIPVRKPGGQFTDIALTLTEDWLHEMHVVQQLTPQQIAKIAGCSIPTIRRYLDMYNIEKPIVEKPYKNEGILRRLYIGEEMTTREIAKILNCSQRTISIHLRKFNIPTRGGGGPGAPYSNGDPELYQDPEWLYEHYVQRDLTMEEMGKIANCTPETIGNWLQRHGIQKEEPLYRNPKWLREMNEDEGVTTSEIASLAKCSQATISRYLRKHNIKRGCKSPLCDCKTLSQKYWVEGKTLNQMGDEIGCDYRKVAYWMKKFNIPRRPRGRPPQ